MPPETGGVLGTFRDEDAACTAARQAAERGRIWELYAPAQNEKVIRRLRPRSPRSAVRAWTLGGGIGGGIAAFAMTIWMMANWPLVVGGKPIVTWPPFICVAFEMTVLYGAFACTAGFLLRARLPRLTLPAAYRGRFGVDRFGVFVAGGREELVELRLALLEAGAESVVTVINSPRGPLEEAMDEALEEAEA